MGTWASTAASSVVVTGNLLHHMPLVYTPSFQSLDLNAKNALVMVAKAGTSLYSLIHSSPTHAIDRISHSNPIRAVHTHSSGQGKFDEWV